MSEKDTLKPGKHFPASMTPPGREDILAELAKYGFEAEGDTRLRFLHHIHLDKFEQLIEFRAV